MFNEKIPPHISLIAADTINFESYISQLFEIIRYIKPFDVKFASFGYFPSTNVVFLNPKESQNLRFLHSQIYNLVINQNLNQFSNLAGISSYNPENWVPHSTLAIGSESVGIPKIIEIAQEILDLQINKPFISKTGKIGLFSYPPFKLLEEIPFLT